MTKGQKIVRDFKRGASILACAATHRVPYETVCETIRRALRRAYSKRVRQHRRRSA